MNRNYTQDQIKTYETVRGALSNLDAITADIISGTSVAAACREHGVDYRYYRCLVTMLQRRGKAQNVDTPESKIDFDNPKYFTFAEKVYAKVFGFQGYDRLSRFMPADAEDSVKEVIESALNQRQKEVIMLHLGEDMSLEEIGARFGITKQCVSNYEQTAIKRLRHPKNASLLEKGLAATKEIIETMNIPLDSIDLSARAHNSLRRARLNSVGDVLKLSQKDLMKIRNMGVKTVGEVVDKIAAYGYSIYPE